MRKFLSTSRDQVVRVEKGTLRNDREYLMRDNSYALPSPVVHLVPSTHWPGIRPISYCVPGKSLSFKASWRARISLDDFGDCSCGIIDIDGVMRAFVQSAGWTCIVDKRSENMSEPPEYILYRGRF